MGCGLNDELRRFGSGFPAGQADSRITGCGKCKGIRAIAGNIGSYIDREPGVGAKGTARPQGATQWWRVVIVERQLRPGTGTDTAYRTSLAGRDVGVNSQGRSGDRAV